MASPASFPMRHADFDQRLASLDALPVHRGRLMRVWLQGQPLDQARGGATPNTSCRWRCATPCPP